MKMTLVAAAVVAAAATTPSLASQELAKNKGCMECHSVYKEVWGPSFQLIAKYNHGVKGHEKALADRIIKGGVQHWGDRNMPAHAARPVPVSDAEAKQLVAWIMKQK